jgi:hypothetical protein
MWGFGRVNKQASQPVKKQEENVTTCSLELIGDLIGHSSSVEVLPGGLAGLARACAMLLLNTVALHKTHTHSAAGFCKTGISNKIMIVQAVRTILHRDRI